MKFVLIQGLIGIILFEIISQIKSSTLGYFVWESNWGTKSTFIQMFAGIQVFLVPIFAASVISKYRKSFMWINLKTFLGKKLDFHYVLFSATLFMSIFHIVMGFFYLHFAATREFLSILPSLVIVCLISLVFAAVVFRKIVQLNLKRSYLLVIPLFLFSAYKSFEIFSTDLSVTSKVLFTLLILAPQLYIIFRIFRAPQSAIFFISQAELVGVMPGISILLFGRVNGERTLSSYEDFWIANLRLYNEGGLPWKSFLLEHGSWADFLRYFISARLTSSTNPSLTIFSYEYIVRPLEYAAILIPLYLISKSKKLIISICSLLLIFHSIFSFEFLYSEFIPIVYITLVLFVVANKSGLFRSFVFGCTVGIAILWSQQVIPGVIAAIIVYIFLMSHASTTLPRNFVALILGFFCTFILPLSLTGILDDWLRSFRWDTSGYFLTWGDGINYRWENGFVYFASFFLIPTILMLVLGLFTYSYICNKLILRRYIPILPIFISSFASYIKFLGWPDMHIVQPQILLSWFIMFGVGIGIRYHNRWNFSPRNGLSLVSIIALSVITINLPQQLIGLRIQKSYWNNGSLVDGSFVSQTNKEYVNRILMIKEKWNNRFGLGTNSTIFDFGNEPVSWFGIAGYKPMQNLTKVLNFYSKDTQEEVINILSANYTKVDGVIWGGEFGIWEWPFGGTWIRQYLISEFILNNFVPVDVEGKYVLFLRNSDSAIASSAAIQALRTTSCDWNKTLRRFVPPVTNKSSPTSIVSEFKGVGTISSSSVFSIEPGNADGLYFESDRDTWIEMSTSETDGKIRFELLKDEGTPYLWLGNCPTWKLQSPLAKWKIVSKNPEAVVRIYNSR